MLGINSFPQVSQLEIIRDVKSMFLIITIIIMSPTIYFIYLPAHQIHIQCKWLFSDFRLPNVRNAPDKAA